MKFTLEAYKELIELIRSKGYQICNYHNYLEYEKFVILRHDVDFDLEKALKMARLEESIGVKSVYFVLISSDFYNVFSKKNQERIKEIQALGHEIGLHFDETKYAGAELKDIKKKIYKEVELLEFMIGKRIGSISMHRPSKEILESNLQLDYVINTYGKIFFEDMKYLSDARMNWREDVISIIKNEEFNKIQLLTHAFWYAQEEENITKRLSDFVEDAKEERYMELGENLRNLESVLPRERIN